MSVDVNGVRPPSCLPLEAALGFILVDFGMALGSFYVSVTASCEGLRRSACFDPTCAPRVRLVKRSSASFAARCCRAHIVASREFVVKHSVPDTFCPVSIAFVASARLPFLVRTGSGRRACRGVVLEDFGLSSAGFSVPG